MDEDKLMETIAAIREDLAEGKQKLKTDYDLLSRLTALVSENDRRLTAIEAAQRAAGGTLSKCCLCIMNLATLAIAILALLKK